MSSHETRAERMRQPLASDVIAATAEQHGVCVRPFTMEVGNLDTGELRYVPIPCGSTVESVCGPCARKARALRMAQCREGWHMTEEPDFTPDRPTADHTALLELRADLVQAYQQAAGQGAGEADELRDEIRSVDEELRQLGMRGRLPNPDGPPPRSPKRSTRRRQDAPDLPTRRVESAPSGGSTRVGSGRPCSSRSPWTATAESATTAPRSTPAPTTTGGRLGMPCTSRRWWTGGGRTCGGSWAGTCSTSPRSNRRALRSTPACRAAGFGAA